MQKIKKNSKELMFKKLNKIRKINKSKAMREANELDYNEDGSVQINVGLKDSEDFFSPYSYTARLTPS